MFRKTEIYLEMLINYYESDLDKSKEISNELHSLIQRMLFIADEPDFVKPKKKYYLEENQNEYSSYLTLDKNDSVVIYRCELCWKNKDLSNYHKKHQTTLEDGGIIEWTERL